ncbi:MAG: glycosyltransferase [Candidatus Moranbacteria bacterium]|nr:glycosyltransferase [Candidatus Moranbacteria bacterium]
MRFKKPISVSVIIVNYKSQEYLERLIFNFVKDLIKLNKEIEIIVFDNSFQLKSLELKKIIHSAGHGIPFRFLKSKKNIGFGRACNIASRKSQGKYLFFINPDCLVKPDQIKKLLKAFKFNPKIGIIAPYLINPKGKIQRYGFAQNQDIWDKLFAKDRNKAEKAEFKLNNKNLKKVKWVSGACFLIPRKIFFLVKGFDENFFLYFEDRDLSKKVRNKGYKTVIFKKVKIIHYESKSKISWSKRKKHYYQSQDYFFLKHYGKIALWIMKFLRLPIYIKNVYLSKFKIKT